ncbi:hypothetical protein PP175_20990 [Aneurinibacillus sp. Ricciae_BoGa-3]|uniref:hypothetical protein n=1 Tax=Aneurinibacillus sp. Ricciae_BoGa-3 TaxID=3022697 RepID=UPI00234129CB|nr:hypothetical protein [Aneurinibacillus sp. Ricciae_BoGa-3]WCK53771.1 hypothetical protein PP175_20990 [Aneurinibacillus sp. Ricciae_BoGa-3]
MTRSSISAVYAVFIILLTVGIPLLLFFGTDEPSGILAAVLAFGILLSYTLYSNLLNRRS